ncbi:MAG: aconitase X [Dehalococcoidales bacterium]|jgi:predicted aconitase
MQLNKDEQKMLDGGYGKGFQHAMRILVEMGEFYDAKRLLPITMAFMTLGPSPAKPAQAPLWLEKLQKEGAYFMTPLAMEPIGQVKDVTNDIHNRLKGVYGIGGSGNARNLFTRPVLGQNLVADGTAVTHYCNSYIGARANTLCFIGQYAAALCGKVPEYGYHLKENRLGKTLFDVKADIKDTTDWGALGYYISITLGTHYWDVPVINGIDPTKVSEDDLVALSCFIPAYGAVVHSLMVGISPEAQDLEMAFGGNKPIEKYTVGKKELQSVFDRFSTKKTLPDMISFGGFGTNVSIKEMYKLDQLFAGKKVSTKFPTVCMVDGPVKEVCERNGINDRLKKAGVQIGLEEFLKTKQGISGSDFSNNPVTAAKRLGLNTLVFFDAKSCHYIGNQEIEPVLKNLEDCVKIAVSGKIEG